MTFMKKRIAQDNINIFLYLENKTQNILKYMYQSEEEKNGEKSATRKEKEKEHLYLPCLDFLASRNHNMSSYK